MEYVCVCVRLGLWGRSDVDCRQYCIQKDQQINIYKYGMCVCELNKRKFYPSHLKHLKVYKGGPLKIILS